jgi:hypothetical protein
MRRSQIMNMLVAAVLTARLADTAPVACGPPHDGPDWQSRKGSTLVYGAGASLTTGAYASGGVIVGRKPARCNRCAFGAISSGILMQGAVGTHASRVSFGRATASPMGSMGAKLSLERAWRARKGTPGGSLYVGPEVDVGFFGLRASTGVLWGVGPSSPKGPRWSLSAGVGF